MPGSGLLALVAVGAYVLGSLPFGLWVGRIRGVDIRALGSGNIGATNVWRVLGPGPGLVVFALDTFKGLAPAIVGSMIAGDRAWGLACGLAAVLGHSASPFLRFRGGKGVATGLGALLGSTPIVAGLALLAFLACLAVTRYVSLSSLFASGVMVCAAFLADEPAAIRVAVALLAVVVVLRHRTNLARLVAGTEPRFEFSRRQPGAPNRPREERHADESPRP